jgi:hypothetical protein
MTNFEAVGVITYFLNEDGYLDVDMTSFAGVGDTDYFRYTLARIRFRHQNENYYVDVRGYSPFNPHSPKTFSSCEVLRFHGKGMHTSLFKSHLSDFDSDNDFMIDLRNKIKEVL